jgi:hypothetical protein
VTNDEFMAGSIFDKDEALKELSVEQPTDAKVSELQKKHTFDENTSTAFDKHTQFEVRSKRSRGTAYAQSVDSPYERQVPNRSFFVNA